MQVSIMEFKFAIKREFTLTTDIEGFHMVTLSPGDTYTLNEYHLTLFPKGFLLDLEHEGYIELIESKGVQVNVDFS